MTLCIHANLTTAIKSALVALAQLLTVDLQAHNALLLMTMK